MSLIAPKPCRPRRIAMELQQKLETVRIRRQNEINSVCEFHSVEKNIHQLRNESESNGRLLMNIHQLHVSKKIRIQWIEKMYYILEFRALLRLAKFVYGK